MLAYGPSNIPNTYLFVDGASLNSALNDIAQVFFGGDQLTVNWVALRGQHRKAYYYDAVDVQNLGEDETAYAARVAPKRRELSLIERQNNYHVRTGDAIRRRREGRSQKMVDVQLAVDALQMASRSLFTGCTIITSDLDFHPLVVALVEMGIEVTLLYQTGHTNGDLLAAADIVNPLDLQNVRTFSR